MRTAVFLCVARVNEACCLIISHRTACCKARWSRIRAHRTRDQQVNRRDTHRAARTVGAAALLPPARQRNAHMTGRERFSIQHVIASRMSKTTSGCCTTVSGTILPIPISKETAPYGTRITFSHANTRNRTCTCPVHAWNRLSPPTTISDVVRR